MENIKMNLREVLEKCSEECLNNNCCYCAAEERECALNIVEAIMDVYKIKEDEF